MLNRHTSQTHEDETKNAPLPPQSEDVRGDMSECNKVIATFMQDGYLREVYAGLPKLRVKEEMKLSHPEGL